MAQNSSFRFHKSINCQGKLLSLSTPVIMGIINITPDSFYDGGKFTDTKKILTAAGRMIREGASIIDLGAQSTRPGTHPLSIKEELKRLLPVLKSLRNKFPDQIFSVDTFYAAVAETAVEHGADLINDISGGTMDKQMFSTVARLKIPYILMHIQQTPLTMQINPKYNKVVREVIDFLQKRVYRLRDAGVIDLLVDPGFGFGKTIKHNFTLLNHLKELKLITGCPVVVGLSRKSLIYKTLNKAPQQALNGTTVLNTVALLNQADILRVHDVKEAFECYSLISEIRN